MNLHEIAKVALAEGLTVSPSGRVNLIVTKRRIALVVGDSRVVVDLHRGFVRVVPVPAPGCHGPPPPEQRVPVDDAAPQIVEAMLRRAIEGGRTPS